MTNAQCPRCGCPVPELVGDVESAHTVAHGRLTYRRCICDAWLLELNGTVIAAPRKESSEKVGRGVEPLVPRSTRRQRLR